MPKLWVVHNGGNPIILQLNDTDMSTLELRYKGKTIARYNEKTEEFIGLVDGKLIKVHWASVKTLAQKFGVEI